MLSLKCVELFAGERSFQERQGCLLAPLLGFRDGLKAAFHSVCVRCCLSLRSDVFSLSCSAMEAWQMLGAELPGEQEEEMLITFRYDSGWLRDILSDILPSSGQGNISLARVADMNWFCVGG